MYDKERAIARDFNMNLGSLEDKVYAWGIRKYKLDKVFVQKHGFYMDRFEDFPKNYQGMMLGSWCFSRVILDPVFRSSFSRSTKESFSVQNMKLLRFWEKNNPVWSLFNIVEKFDIDIFRIQDQLTGTEMLIHSSSISSMDTNIPIISILVPLEGIWVSYGIIHYYKGATARHILDLMRMMDKPLYENRDFTSFIQKHYSHFFQIDKAMEIPVVVKGTDVLEPNWTEMFLPDFDPKKLSANFHIEESEEIIRLEPFTNEPFPYAQLFFHQETKMACVSSMTLRGYRELCKLIPDLRIPENPDFCFSMSLFSVMEKEMDIYLPPSELAALFDNKENNPTTQEQTVPVNLKTLFEEAFHAQNQSKTFNLYKRGKELGVDDETIKSIADTLERLNTKLQKPN